MTQGQGIATRSSRKSPDATYKGDVSVVKAVAPNFTARQKSALQRSIRIARAYAPSLIMRHIKLALDDKYAFQNGATIQDRDRSSKIVLDIGVPRHLVMAVNSEAMEPVNLKAIFREVLSEMVTKPDATEVQWQDVPEHTNGVGH